MFLQLLEPPLQLLLAKRQSSLPAFFERISQYKPAFW
jgi:hypothetical protein